MASILVNDDSIEIQEGAWNGHKLKEHCKVPESWDLARLDERGKKWLVLEDRTVFIRDGDRFVSLPAGSGS